MRFANSSSQHRAIFKAMRWTSNTLLPVETQVAGFVTTNH